MYVGLVSYELNFVQTCPIMLLNWEDTYDHRLIIHNKRKRAKPEGMLRKGEMVNKSDPIIAFYCPDKGGYWEVVKK